jgi:hypothetical protein
LSKLFALEAFQSVALTESQIVGISLDYAGQYCATCGINEGFMESDLAVKRDP